jgi:hypothetical protein
VVFRAEIMYHGALFLVFCMRLFSEGLAVKRSRERPVCML